MRRFYLLLAATVAALDLGTKALIMRVIPLESGASIKAIPGCFSLVHVQNPGVVFGLLSDAPRAWQSVALVVVSTALAAVIAALLWRQPRRRATLSGVALALVLGGALGNLLDRAVRGAVTDFLDFFLAHITGTRSTWPTLPS